nr:MAG TPA: hypothetical protein [Caudoviricetes sp.]
MITIDDRELKQLIQQLKYFDTTYFDKDFRNAGKKAAGPIMTKWAKDANTRINFPFSGGHAKSGKFSGSMRRYSKKDKRISKSRYKYKKQPIQEKNGEFSFKLKNQIGLSNIWEAKQFTPHIGTTQLATKQGFGNKEKTEQMFSNYTQDFVDRLADFVKKQVERKSKV